MTCPKFMGFPSQQWLEGMLKLTIEPGPETNLPDNPKH